MAMVGFDGRCRQGAYWCVSRKGVRLSHGSPVSVIEVVVWDTGTAAGRCRKMRRVR